MKKLFQRLHDWYQSVLPERWRGKTGLAFLFLMWIVIFIFEGFWLVTGETDLWLLLGMPGFFAIITFIILRYGLEVIGKNRTKELEGKVSDLEGEIRGLKANAVFKSMKK